VGLGFQGFEALAGRGETLLVEAPTPEFGRCEEAIHLLKCGDCFARLPLGPQSRLRGLMNIPDGWTASADGAAIEKSFRFKDFSEAFAVLTRVAMHAEKVDHHPEFTSVWNRIDFRLTSHDTGGVTERDVALASAIDGFATK
jgi:4a-hydroxytetrahydrobiopterin dehydratase